MATLATHSVLLFSTPLLLGLPPLLYVVLYDPERPRTATKPLPEIKPLTTSSVPSPVALIGEANRGKTGNLGQELYKKYLDKYTFKAFNRTADAIPKQSVEDIQDDCAHLKRTVVAKIVGERIYKTEKLKELYAGILKEHPRIPKRKLQAMWQDIMSELNA